MADETTLNWIGYAFGGLTAIVILVAALVVHNATANESSNGSSMILQVDQ